MANNQSESQKIQSLLDEARDIIGEDPEGYEEEYRRIVFSLATMLSSIWTEKQMLKQFNGNADHIISFDRIVGFPEQPGLYLYQPPGTFGIRMFEVQWTLVDGEKVLIDIYGEHKVDVRTYKGSWYKVKGQYHDVRTDA